MKWVLLLINLHSAASSTTQPACWDSINDQNCIATRFQDLTNIYNSYVGVTAQMTEWEPLYLQLQDILFNADAQAARVTASLYGPGSSADSPSGVTGLKHFSNLLAGEMDFANQNILETIAGFEQVFLDIANSSMSASISGYPTLVKFAQQAQQLVSVALFNARGNENTLVNRGNWYLQKLSSLSNNLTDIVQSNLNATVINLTNTELDQYRKLVKAIDYASALVNSTNLTTITPILTQNWAESVGADAKNITRFGGSLANIIKNPQYVTSLDNTLNAQMDVDMNSDNQAYTSIVNRYFNLMTDLIYKANVTELATNSNLTALGKKQDVKLAQYNAFVGRLVNDTTTDVMNLAQTVSTSVSEAQAWSGNITTSVSPILSSIAIQKAKMLKQLKQGYRTANATVLAGLMNLISANDDVKQSLTKQADDLKNQMTGVLSDLAASLGMSMSEFSSISGNMTQVVNTIKTALGYKLAQTSTEAAAGVTKMAKAAKLKLSKSALALKDLATGKNAEIAKSLEAAQTAVSYTKERYLSMLQVAKAAMKAQKVNATTSGSSRSIKYQSIGQHVSQNSSELLSNVESTLNAQKAAMAQLMAQRAAANEGVAKDGDLARYQAEELNRQISQVLNSSKQAAMAIMDQTVNESSSSLESNSKKAMKQLYSLFSQAKTKSAQADTAVSKYRKIVGAGASILSDVDASVSNSVRGVNAASNGTLVKFKRSLSRDEAVANGTFGTQLSSSLSGLQKYQQNLRKVTQGKTDDIAKQFVAPLLNSMNSKVDTAELLTKGQLDASNAAVQQLQLTSASAASQISKLQDRLEAVTDATTALAALYPSDYALSQQSITDRNSTVQKFITDTWGQYANGTTMMIPQFTAQLKSIGSEYLGNVISLENVLNDGTTRASAVTVDAAASLAGVISTGIQDLVSNVFIVQAAALSQIQAALGNSSQQVVNGTLLQELQSLKDELQALIANSSANSSYAEALLSSVGGQAGSLLQATSSAVRQAMKLAETAVAGTVADKNLASQIQAVASQANLAATNQNVISAAEQLGNASAALAANRHAAQNNAATAMQQILDSQQAMRARVDDSLNNVAALNLTAPPSMLDDAAFISNTFNRLASVWALYTQLTQPGMKRNQANQADMLSANQLAIDRELHNASATINSSLLQIDSILNASFKLPAKVEAFSLVIDNTSSKLEASSNLLNTAGEQLQKLVLTNLTQIVEDAREDSEKEAESAVASIDGMVAQLTEMMNQVTGNTTSTG